MNTMEDKQFDRNQPDDLRQQIAEGLLYAHSRANSNTTRTLEAASFLYALIELMGEKGLITIEQVFPRSS